MRRKQHFPLLTRKLLRRAAELFEEEEENGHRVASYMCHAIEIASGHAVSAFSDHRAQFERLLTATGYTSPWEWLDMPGGGMRETRILTLLYLADSFDSWQYVP